MVFIDLNSEQAGNLSAYPVVENKPGKGYGITFPNAGFVTMNNDFIYRHAFITHRDIPFFIAISRKKFLTDLLEFYDREKPLLVANMQNRIKKTGRNNNRIRENPQQLFTETKRPAGFTGAKC